MKYLLDANACIGYLNGTAHGVLVHLQNLPISEIAVCAVVKAEMFAGARQSQRIEQTLAHHREFFNRFSSLPFDDEAAEAYSRIRAHLEKRGTPIGPNDLMIAAIAVANNVTLITHNTREFGRVPGLALEDWEV